MPRLCCSRKVLNKKTIASDELSETERGPWKRVDSIMSLRGLAKPVGSREDEALGNGDVFAEAAAMELVAETTGDLTRRPQRRPQQVPARRSPYRATGTDGDKEVSPVSTTSPLTSTPGIPVKRSPFQGEFSLHLIDRLIELNTVFEGFKRFLLTAASGQKTTSS